MVAALASMALRGQASAPGWPQGAPVPRSPPGFGGGDPHCPPWGSRAGTALPPRGFLLPARSGLWQCRGCASAMPIPAPHHVNTGLSREIRGGAGGTPGAEPPCSGDVSRLRAGTPGRGRGLSTGCWCCQCRGDAARLLPGGQAPIFGAGCPPRSRQHHGVSGAGMAGTARRDLCPMAPHGASFAGPPPPPPLPQRCLCLPPPPATRGTPRHDL